jgi:hypothetical protein
MHIFHRTHPNASENHLVLIAYRDRHAPGAAGLHHGHVPGGSTLETGNGTGGLLGARRFALDVMQDAFQVDSGALDALVRFSFSELQRDCVSV